MKRAFLLALFAVALSAQYTPPAGGGGGFPTVVASVVDTGVTTSKTYNNLASAPTDDGLYVLTYYWTATTIDPATSYGFVVNWTDQNGTQGGNASDGLTPAQYPVPLFGEQSIAVMHPSIGTSIVGSWVQVPTGLQTISVSAGHGGAGYAAGDVGTIAEQIQSAALFPSQYIVQSVDGGGAVLTIGVSLKGSGHTLATNVATSPRSGGGDGNLQVDITALAPMLGVFSYYATLERLH